MRICLIFVAFCSFLSSPSACRTIESRFVSPKFLTNSLTDFLKILFLTNYLTTFLTIFFDDFLTIFSMIFWRFFVEFFDGLFDEFSWQNFFDKFFDDFFLRNFWWILIFWRVLMTKNLLNIAIFRIGATAILFLWKNVEDV